MSNLVCLHDTKIVVVANSSTDVLVIVTKVWAAWAAPVVSTKNWDDIRRIEAVVRGRSVHSSYKKATKQTLVNYKSRMK